MIQLNYRDSRPIYEQIKTGLRNLICQGAIDVDEKLPSVRDLASQLAINPNTIQKAYRELEQEGYVYTISGRGTFASDYKDINSDRVNKLLKTFDETTRELIYLSQTSESLKERIDSIYKEGGVDND